MTTAIPYAERSEWSDVKPASLSEGPAPFAPILFTDEYKDAMAYFVATAHSGELSQRVFDLTSHLVKLNQGLYTVWRTRQLILDELHGDLHAELHMLNEMMDESPKSYQLWQHRQFVMERLREPAGELEFMKSLSEEDPKNYHMWNYRQWLVTTFGLWEGELAAIDELLLSDVRNNSAWTYRFFLLFGSQELEGRVMDVDVDKELEYVVSAIRRAPSNESPWVYMRGVLKREKRQASAFVMGMCRSLVEGQCLSPHLYAFLVDEYVEQQNLDAATETCLHLEQVVDKTRAKYWAFKRQQILSKK
ncbi:farnesyltransferase [Catenaria anguillulae PL171]|uniref:Protein farnesyltransferase/geranylgeranyltransferase type-1 subunit alpha n=1 Tax=Catenaria anguillulae PL171 TaxID=765915 RepID=A0A1Y2I2P3_9FUNG|nr:farnesyltransferase [Catenaria anguillulae PL171]